MNTLPIEELRKLLSAVSEHGNKHLVDVESDLKQAAFLLNEAVETLGSSFLALDAQIESQKAIMQAASANGLDASTKAAIEDIQAQIQTQIQQVVTNLQFQDMTNQIIERCLKRVDGIKGLLEEVGNHGDNADVCLLVREREEISEYIQSLKKSLNAGSDAIAGGINHKSVNQQNMSSGSVDLF